MRRRAYPSSISRSRVRRVLMFATLALAVVPSAATAAVITFDDLTPAPPPPGSHGTPVNTQYASQGVTFNDPEAFTYGSSFAHSDGVGVEACVAVEFCQAPIRADFTAPQDSVGVWVGYHASLSQAETVQLNAFDASNTQIASDTATLPANSSVTPIQTHLTVSPSGGGIAHVEITTGSGYNNFLAIDDLEFTTAGPPPPCNATGPPTVNLTQPSGGIGVQNNAFTIAGSVNPNGDQLTGASFVATSSTTHSASIFPILIGSAGGSFGPISVEGLLSPGNNDVTVTATNCAGTGTSVARPVEYSPIPPGTQFNQLGMIEVNQTVQNTFDSVPLIAAGASTFKRTIARVYLGVQGTPAVTQVTGTLEASLPNGSRAPGPAQVASLNTITVLSANTALNTRSNLASSLNFELPKEWLAAGRIHLQLAHLYVEGQENHLPCNGCDNPFTDSITPASYRFYAVPPVRIWLVRVPYKPSPTAASVAPTQNDIDMLVSWLKRTYPTAEVSDTQMWMPVQNDHPEVRDSKGNVTSAGFTCDDINSRLKDWASSMQAQAANTRYYGVVSDNGGTMFMRGCSEIGGTYGSGPAGVGSSFSNFSWDTDSSYADWYGGHEIGHLYGRLHPGYCNGNSHDDSNYPYGGGLIGGSSVNGILADTQGVDVGDSSLSLPMRLLDWRSGATDIMTYCSKEWMSDYTYEGILNNLCGHEQQNCPDHSALGAAASVSAARSRRDTRLRLVVNGSLSLSDGRLRLRPLLALRGPLLTVRPRRSHYSIVEQSAGHRVLASYPFAPKTVSDLPPGQRVASVHEVVPFNRGTRWILVTGRGRVLARVHVSRHAPTVELLAPAGRRRLGRHVVVRWRAHDKDGGRRIYSLLYSPDGRTFVPIAADLHRTSYRVDTSRLPGGRRARFRVIASDGVLTGIATSKKPLIVAFKRPRVSIASPRSGSRFSAGNMIQFTADVQDIQSQFLPRRSIVWRSSRSGVIGRGQTILVRLKPGTQKISVTATNRGGKRATSTITVDVLAVPRVFKVGP